MDLQLAAFAFKIFAVASRPTSRHAATKQRIEEDQFACTGKPKAKVFQRSFIESQFAERSSSPTAFSSLPPFPLEKKTDENGSVPKRFHSAERVFHYLKMNLKNARSANSIIFSTSVLQGIIWALLIHVLWCNVRYVGTELMTLLYTFSLRREESFTLLDANTGKRSEQALGYHQNNSLP